MRFDDEYPVFLERYYVAGWQPGQHAEPASLFLHHFLASDPSNEVHSHPWGFGVSLLLVGGYVEDRCDEGGHHTVNTFQPGTVNVILASTRHRITLLDRDCWTLFLCSGVVNEWQFFPACTK
jgi:hypothetical protein